MSVSVKVEFAGASLELVREALLGLERSLDTRTREIRRDADASPRDLLVYGRKLRRVRAELRRIPGSRP